MIAWFKQLGSWLVRIAIWLTEAKQAWFAMLAVPGVFIICWVALPTWEQRIRFTGMLLELSGLGTVALGIRETGKLFGRPRLSAITRRWIERFPRFKREIKVVTGAAHINLEGIASAEAFGSATLSTTSTLEQRIAFLEQRLEQTTVLIHENQQKVTQETRKLSSAIDTVRRDREIGDEKNSRLIQEAMAGGLYLETIGVFWLLCGITFATASSEIGSFVFGAK